MALLQAGVMAPAFTGTDQNGKPFSLESLRGRKVILYFYPTDDTPTCTTEACNLRDNYKLLQQQGYTVVGVSTDSVQRHQKFIHKYNLPFTLLADTNHEIISQFGAWAQKVLFGHQYMGTLRVTFIIDEVGKIQTVIDKVQSKHHAQQILSGGAPIKVPRKLPAKKATKPKATSRAKTQSGKKSKVVVAKQPKPSANGKRALRLRNKKALRAK